ncbi:alpha-ketoglutarate-dependent dioxygenase AlkB [Geodermatophilus sp. YIM 151500]|uniref:alpha-ketoglutarate-dependent dioxygenase AlkB n=1 Tax=Geodermatophilus sp. YIM 151500 TaxID=2984531 RepID=UPI0021E3A24B|nr:alpha-ketoglutarate-dependent dioxygenase AlkB [Geodermatophilus sp. YIM 151500]MCV2491138.1 alpha-ketoglutarate-dependent dioxygenase AlkB [Geodermatophilus sp. YIM 151500]
MAKEPTPLIARTLAASVRTGPSQPTFWDTAEEPALTPLVGRVARRDLGSGAWVDHLPGWITGSEAVLEVLLGDIGWREDRRQMYDRQVAVPRLLRWYGGAGILPHPLLAEARSALNAYYQAGERDRFVTAGLCLYRDGRDSVAWHGDRLGRGATDDTMVAIVSFGSPRPLMLRPTGGGAPTMRFPLGHGDLVVMGGSCQRTWEHCIPKTARPVGPRVSVQFRPTGVA